MTDPVLPEDSESFVAGSLMEAAYKHMELADKAIERMDAVAKKFGPVVREAVAHTAAQAVGDAARGEFAQLRSETQRTAQALQGIRGGLSWNLAILASVMAVLCTATAVGGVYLLGGMNVSVSAAAPKAPAGLKGDPAVLAEFAKQGWQVEVALCGEKSRPCVRVDPKSPGFGPRREYLVLPAK